MQHDVIEQVRFRARSAQAETRMAEAAWAAQAAIEQLPGFVARQFGRSDDGEWIDVVRWSSLQAARAAAEQAGRHPDIANFFAQIDMHTVELRHYAAPAPASLWSSLAPARRATLCLMLTGFDAWRRFYEAHFNARALFEGDSYLVLQLGGPLAPELHAMRAESGVPAFSGHGLMLNLQFDDVDALHARLAAEQVPLRMPLDDHPWGDRAFSCVDPAGLELYCYSPRPMAPAFAEGLRQPWRLEAPATNELEDTEPA